MDPILSPQPVPRPERPADPTASLVRSMRRIAQAIDVRSREIARLSGLTLPQLIVLQSVRSLGEVTTQAISRDAAMSAPTVVGVLDKLEAKGLVVRYRSTRDRRVVHVRTTEAGQAALEDSPDLLGDGFIAAFGRLPVERRRDLAEALDLLAGFMVGTAPIPTSPPASAD